MRRALPLLLTLAMAWSAVAVIPQHNQAPRHHGVAVAATR